MAFPEYKPITDLTDEELETLLQVIYPKLGSDDPNAPEILMIDRYENYEQVVIKVLSPIHDDDESEAGMMEDNLTLEECGMTADSFTLMPKEDHAVHQFLLAKGCNYYLKDNPYL